MIVNKMIFFFSHRFANLCVQHVTRKKSAEVIEHRIIESMKLDKLAKERYKSDKAIACSNGR